MVKKNDFVTQVIKRCVPNCPPNRHSNTLCNQGTTLRRPFVLGWEGGEFLLTSWYEQKNDMTSLNDDHKDAGKASYEWLNNKAKFTGW